MKSSSYQTRNKKDKPENSSKEKASCCDIHISITNQGKLNIYNCSDIGGEQGIICPPQDVIPMDGCIPVVAGKKHKKNLQARLRPLLEKNKIPSVLAGSFFRYSRRYLKGYSPANALESSIFSVFENMPQEIKGLLNCSLQKFESLPKADREKLIAPEFANRSDAVITPEQLADLVAEELAQRASLEIFGDPRAIKEERPGKARIVVDDLDDVGVVHVRIWKVNDIRTNEYMPSLGIGDYRPEELQQQCTPQEIDGEIVLNCEVLTENCPGHQKEGACLKAPDVIAGEAVVLEGVNFFSTDSKVKITAQSPGQASVEVDAHVFGDIDTPETETIDGTEEFIVDSRVKDLITFRVPEDLATGIYRIHIIVPNDIDHPDLSNEAQSGLQYINVCPPANAEYQITSEILDAVKETSPAGWGSDEVGIRIIAIPFSPDLELGEMTEHNLRFDDVDSGETRDMSRVLFQASNTGGVTLSILGYEVDSEDAYEQQIEDFTDAYVEILKREWKALTSLISVGTIWNYVKGLGLKGALILAIAVAVVLIINIFIALWAAADLIMEDNLGLTAKDISILTSANFPPPAVEEFTSAGDIKVKIESEEKGASQYRERRKYSSDEEDSEYHIVLRYNRLT